MGQHGYDGVGEAVGLDATALTGRQINGWFDRKDWRAACGHEDTFRAGPHLVCRGCGASEQDAPVERGRVVFAEFGDAGDPDVHPDAAAVPLEVMFPLLAARRRLDEEARAEAAGLPVDCRWPL